MVCVYVLFVQCCSRPHCAHRLGAGAPHWHPPCGTQHAQFCLTKSWLQRHPCDSCVHKSTWPAKKIDRKHTQNAVTILSSLLIFYCPFTIYMQRSFYALNTLKCDLTTNYYYFERLRVPFEGIQNESDFKTRTTTSID